MCSCMEHHCCDCKHEWFDNRPRTPCPQCGSTHGTSIWDEDPRDFDDDDTVDWEED